MTMEHMIRLIAGTFVLTSVALGWFVSPWFFLFTAFVGANLLQSALTKWCLMEKILGACGVGHARDARSADRHSPGPQPA